MRLHIYVHQFPSLLLLVFTSVFVVVVVIASDINDGPVCSTNQNTYGSYNELILANEDVLHCGPCGACSNNHDINIYVETRNTLTETTGNCAILSLIGIFQPLEKAITKRCLMNRVGFSNDCLNCWVDNIVCSKQYCPLICFKYLLRKRFTKNDNKNEDDPCLVCDETNCGTPFITCAGANRRRSGIQSDIDRSNDEICTLVTRP
jgi:hypothetical protein